MGIWAWIQPVDRIWKVVSDSDKGTLFVYNEKNELIMNRKGMTREEISFVEDNFLKVVATDLGGNKEIASPAIETSKQEHNYMYA